MIKGCDHSNNELKVRYSSHGLNSELSIVRNSNVSVIRMFPLFECFRYSNVRYSDPHCTNRIATVSSNNYGYNCVLFPGEGVGNYLVCP